MDEGGDPIGLPDFDHRMRVFIPETDRRHARKIQRRSTLRFVMNDQPVVKMNVTRQIVNHDVALGRTSAMKRFRLSSTNYFERRCQVGRRAPNGRHQSSDTLEESDRSQLHIQQMNS